MPDIAEAILHLAEKQLFPTHLGTRELRQIAKDVRAQSIFSARVAQLPHIEKIQELVEQMLGGELNQASARFELQKFLQETEFPIPGDRGITDLQANVRINLQLETISRHAANFGRKEQGMEDAALYQFPAWELVRIYDKLVPRDSMPDPDEHWDSRFEQAGGTIIDGRLIALKTDLVWDSLGDSNLFDDGLDSTTPPYWFNSGGGWRDVPRAEAVELGLLDKNQLLEPKDTGRLFDEDDIDLGDLSDQTLRDMLKNLRAP